MKPGAANIAQPARSIALALAVVVTGLVCLPSSWAFAEGAGQPCPLTGQRYEGRIEMATSVPRAGEPITLRVILDPQQPPPGFTISSLVEVLQAPAESRTEILPGYPKIRLTCSKPGRHLLKVRVSMIAKTSCGGVTSARLLQRRIAFEVRP